ncbi:hypothetical protein NX801_22205 [Streptomyces sp. LP05-1]|uniref:Uncharacterized protein n=2 Tax=Streptomyces pyxinae TaxID=2970734 RepID=A0ABT2CM37_9ACTN|nr:hypothetical protein [Streptomyces sp. LP05-1]MCS0638316.1 hypothetical protein [Streptomyces sp. LP05-1]
MHPYEPARQSYQQIPAMRPAQESSPGVSATPIYDALYSEYLRSFRTLPGDRSGEEDMGFKAFSTGSGTSGTGLTYGGMRAGAYATQTIPSPPQAHPHSGYPGQWQPVAVRPHAGHFPALPPAPRRET